MILVVVIFLAVPQLLKLKPIERAATKQFATFEEFYPFYISQHQDTMCRRLHVIGTALIALIALYEPFILPSLIMAAMMGYTAFLATAGVEHGVYEMIFMLMTFQLFMRRLTGDWRKGLIVPVIAYTFAWVGHFYFEHNRPATFIYPVYSLAGDFRLFFEVISRQREF